jgi:threonine/homoserine/homoserine lactone efflux protein
MVQTGLLVAGVSALVAASPTAFFVMQCLGAAYLLYLAYRSFQVRAGNVAIDDENHKPSDVGHPSARKLYLRGIIMNLSNPKVILFLLSFIPPAVRLDRPIHPSLQMAIFGAEFILATFIVFGSIALLAGAVKKFLLNSPKANRNLNWFSCCVFVLLAVALFLV